MATATGRTRSAARPGTVVPTSASRPATATTVTSSRGVTVGAARPVMPTLHAVSTARAIPLPSEVARSSGLGTSVRSMRST
ncbi:hypothetical protein BIV23_17490 [Streptomyces monashensis]|uniref:Uncharacterized protein n=1 Tax=Streptomyces monashensis TaxID=1678012 RepID=A0A1S2QFD2_9ACTN|nr:hypothetical protein BIV23_17490 [Streptomyces monashensis]